MNDTLETLWSLPVVEEPVTGEAKVTQKEDKPEEQEPCSHYKTARECKNPPIVIVFWTTCICGHTVKESRFCLPCYEGYPYTTVGEQKVRVGTCKKCMTPVYMKSIVPYSKRS